MTTHPAVLSLGSNMGDRAAQLRRAVELLAAQIPCLGVSPVYETLPVGGPEQGEFLNAVMLSATETPAELLTAAQRVEAALGRVRGE
ncbi:MAG: 2-amino-4-hydroxy-6-hydroxymethyldihydropteridine diphosphokinase, partial [Frankia sp.]|nr:2-amino-4-hydroxy-6-hydroxymethyldihydropteridine diphosphokinase [Frankia sp.]